MAEKFRPLRVLVVEDESLIRWSIVETLSQAGLAVSEAADGAGAIKALSGDSESVDAILLDYRLPDSNDLTLLAALRRLSPQSAVVLMTAFSTPAVVAGARELGVYRLLHKPFELHELEPLVREACQAGHH